MVILSMLKRYNLHFACDIVSFLYQIYTLDNQHVLKPVINNNIFLKICLQCFILLCIILRKCFCVMGHVVFKGSTMSPYLTISVAFIICLKDGYIGTGVKSTTPVKTTSLGLFV